MTMSKLTALFSITALLLAPLAALHAAEKMKPLPPGCVKVGGEIGRRIELTVTNNLLKLDVEKDFLAPLKEKKGGYIGVGILLDAASRLAAATGAGVGLKDTLTGISPSASRSCSSTESPATRACLSRRGGLWTS
jgi:hypothetical protein